MNRYLRNDADPVAFVKAARECKGSVWMDTGTGDRLDLKSALSTFAFALMAQDGEKKRQIRIHFDEKDLQPLKEYLTAYS